MSNDDPPAKRAKALSGSNITSRQLFNEAFGGQGYSVEVKPSLQLNVWNNPTGLEKIKAWLKSYGPSFISLISKIERNSESSLYPLIVNTLVPIMDITQYKIDPKEKESALFDNIDDVADLIVENIQRESLNNNNNAQDAENAGMLNTMNAADVKKFIVYVEETVKSNLFDNGDRVEILVHSENGDPAKKEIVFEAKPATKTDNDEGIFQTAAYLAIGGVSYGVYTSHKCWKFLKMEKSQDGTTVIRHSKYLDLMKASYEEFDQDSVQVYANLLEIFGVPRETDLMAASAAAKTALHSLGEYFTRLI